MIHDPATQLTHCCICGHAVTTGNVIHLESAANTHVVHPHCIGEYRKRKCEEIAALEALAATDYPECMSRSCL